MTANTLRADEAEQAVLSAVMCANDTLDEVATILNQDDFGSARCAAVYRAMCALSVQGKPIDIVTLRDEVVSRGDLQRAGGDETLMSLTTGAGVVHAHNVTTHARIVRDKAVARRLLLAGHEIVSRTQAGTFTTDELLDHAEYAVWNVSDKRESARTQSARDVVIHRFQAIQEAANAGHRMMGLPTGFEKLDAMLCGLKGGELIIVAGRPSMGKSALAASFVETVCSSGHGVAVFPLEMSNEQWIDRHLASNARVDAGRIRSGQLRGEDWPGLTSASARIADWNLQLDDTPGLTIMQLRSKARRARSKHGIRMVVVDYLQLMSAGIDTQSREQEVAAISRSAKLLAKELNVPVIMLSQLNREVAKRADKRPTLSDLRESGAIEQDADVVIFVHREEVYDPNTKDVGIAELIVAKQRSGPTGTVRTRWFGEFTRFDDLEEYGNHWEAAE